MPWLQRIIPESIKKSVCAYLLQRYLGQFFEEKVTRDQLSVDLYNGTGTVEKISLDVQALNELGDKQNWPMEFIDGYIDKLYICVPWTSLLKDSSYVEVEGLKITVQPKQRTESATSMFESMWNSMTSSMQLAEDCAKLDAANNVNNAQQPYEGIEIFAQTIDSILSRVRVKFTNTVVQIEHVPKDSLTGVGIIINIGLIEYSDEAGNDPPNDEVNQEQDANKGYVVQAFTTKKFKFEEISLSTVEFSSKARTFSRSLLLHQSLQHEEESGQLDSLGTIIRSGDDDTENCEGPPHDDNNSSSLPQQEDQRHVVLFGKLSNKQEVRIRMKQSESLCGPKVSIEVNLGGLVLFLSPRQVHMLLELANGLASPDMQDTSNVPHSKSKCVDKPMTTFDYQRVEQELQQQLHPLSNFQAPGMQGHGWSTAPLDESDTEDNFLPMKNNNASGLYDSTLSGASSSMESSITSSMASSFTEHSNVLPKNRRRTHNIDTDPTAEISHFQIRMASLSVVLLHEDLLTLSTDGQSLTLSSVKQMQTVAQNFFKSLGPYVLSAYSSKDFESTKKVFESACQLNHLRLLAAPVQIEGDEKTTTTAFSITGQLTAAKLEILECLYQSNDCAVEYVPLLTFNDATAANFSAKPCLKLNFKHVEKTSKNSRRVNVPKTDLTITLKTCTIELDLTIVDRISAILNPQPVCLIEKPTYYNPWNPTTAPLLLEIGTTQTESQTDIKIVCPNISVNLRFPIPDFRPSHDMNRQPWWKRNVRPDYLLLELSDTLLQTSFLTAQAFQEYSVQCGLVDVFYVTQSDKINLARSGEEHSSLRDGFHNSRLSIKVFPVKKFDLEETIEPEQQQDPMTQSIYGAFENQSNKQPGPFSAKKIVHESDTPHSKPQKDDSEELIIPGDKQELDDFIKSTTSCARIQVDITLPSLSMQLISKHVYELIYNRINNDLLLWQPSAPKPKTDQINYNVLGNLNADVVPEMFAMCKSGIQYESESESDDESNEETVFYSTYDNRKKLQNAAPKLLQTTGGEPNKGQSYLVLNLNIAQGVLCMHTPCRDPTTNNVIPEQHGEFLLKVENATVFVVGGYKGDQNLGFVCVEVANAQLYHCDMLTTASQSPPLRETGMTVPDYLKCTVHKSDNGMLADAKGRGGDRELLTVAVKIQATHETHHVKTVRVALGINKGTLMHRMCNEPNSWISQMLDFFTVQDYPIPGYVAKDVLTELHVHLWDCAIDYRPLYLPLRAAVTLGNFSISSHLSAQANSSTLRFIAEECGLFLSEKAPPINGKPSSAPVNLKRDYVSVIELGLFELSLRINDKKIGKTPHFDLRASNNVVHIHTCADTCKALTQLITYFASDGDLIVNDVVNNVSTYASPTHMPDQELVNVEPQGISKLSKSQHQHVNELIGEAMEESINPNENFGDLAGGPGAKLFFFPDEHQLQQETCGTKPFPQVTCELGDVAYNSNKSSDTDDDFCFVGNEAGLGIPPKNGLPLINWLTTNPVHLIENHFSIPIGESDALKPPKHYPTPLYRYTLCKMTVIWSLYGGHDFIDPDSETQKKKKTVNFCDTQLDTTVGFTKQQGQVIFTNVNKPGKLHWKVSGGVNRDHSVLMEFQLNKIRFQHEVYPENTVQASRQVLLVSDVEIRDRLASSNFNKFLYQYTSQARPKQSHAHMIMIKTVHIRPDPKLKSQECCLKVSLLPLRLNIDQDSLLFLITFFNQLGTSSNSSEDGGKKDELQQKVGSKHNTPTHQPPVMTINSENEQEVKENAQKLVGENLLILLEENRKEQEPEDAGVVSNCVQSENPPVYYRNVIFSPDVPIRLDYHGKRVDMTHGPLPGLLMGLGQLNCSELRLKRISHRHGLLGFDKLIAFFLQEWLNDIKKNQLPSLLGGVGPMHSLVQLIQGIRDLFWLPIEQYQKDGRIVRGLQRGANSFTTSTAMAALELTSRLIYLIQITAETAYDMLSPGPSVRRIGKIKGKKKRYNQPPQDIREGVTNAYMLVKEGIGETAGNIVQVASHEHEQKGYSGAVGGVIREIPSAMIKPIIIASAATSNVLVGMRSQLVPDARTEANQKWRSESNV